MRRELAAVKGEMSWVVTQVTALVAAGDAGAPGAPPAGFQPSFPLQSMEDVDILEDELREDAKKQQLVIINLQMTPNYAGCLKILIQGEFVNFQKMYFIMK